MNVTPISLALVIVSSLFATSVRAQALQDIGTGAGPQCAGADVDNAGRVVGACREAAGSATGFFSSAPGTAVTLPELVNSRSCTASAITESGRIIGTCLDSASVPTTVIWSASAIGAPQELNGLALSGVRSQATAFNDAAAIAGVSLSANGTALPVMWRSGETAARALPAPLGLAATNCEPQDVDSVAADPNFPAIVGNCPGDNGRPRPVLWTKILLGLSYGGNTLAAPAGTIFCAASRINNGRILGSCDFGTQGGKTVLWTSPTAAPIVLATTPGRNSGRSLNAYGEVIGHYVNDTGDSIPYHWDTATNIRTDIPPISGGDNVGVTAIADDGTVVGTSQTADGDSHAFRWTLGAGTEDLGTLAGGQNSASAAISTDGCYLTGSSEAGAQDATRAFRSTLCPTP